jgi:hypothetical protein
MQVVLPEGKTLTGPVKRFVTGFVFESFTLDEKDVQALSLMSDARLVEHVRQLAARVLRVQGRQ